MSIKQEIWGEIDGKPVYKFSLENKNGLKTEITNFGGSVISLHVPDRNGVTADVVLGYDKLDGYVNDACYFGCIVGRYGNRIGKAHFVLGDREYRLAANNGPNNLHGGVKGFNKFVWAPETSETESGPTLILTRTSPDGEEGFPGNLRVKAVYTLTDDNALQLEFEATTDQDTLCNLTNHSYFNLAGDGVGDVSDHEVEIKATRITAINRDLIPTGELTSVKGTPLDFTSPHTIGSRLTDEHEQMLFAEGYDHNFVIDKADGEVGLAAIVREPSSSRVMKVYTTAPGVQFYGGNFLDGVSGKAGKLYERRTAFCFEPQHYPDSPNRPEFPSTVLKPGETYRNLIRYTF